MLEEASGAFASGQMTVRYFLNVVMISHIMRLEAIDDATSRSPAEVARLRQGLESALALAERQGDQFHVGQCHDVLAHAGFWEGDEDAQIRHLTAAREAFVTGNMPWFAASAEALLAEHALRTGNPQQAETLATDALAHAAHLEPRRQAIAASIRARAIGQLPGRAADYADASLSAAAHWDRISEADAVHNTFNAARAYASLGRHAEAVALFAEAMPFVAVCYTRPGSRRRGRRSGTRWPRPVDT